MILVVSAAGEAAETGAGVGAGVVAAGRGTEECVMPKGNEQSAQIRNNVNEAGLQRVEEQLQPEQKMKEEREPELEQKQEQKEHNNMLVKPKLKLSKKSWQITGRDQDELRCDEVANINNGQQRSPQWQGLEEKGQVLQESQHCSHPQQYQNYHCSTGKSASSSNRRSSNSSGDEAKLSQSTSANKLSTVKRATAAAGATAAEIALVVATATETPAAVAVAVAANSAGESSVRPGRGHQ